MCRESAIAIEEQHCVGAQSASGQEGSRQSDGLIEVGNPLPVENQEPALTGALHGDFFQRTMDWMGWCDSELVDTRSLTGLCVQRG